MVKKHARITTFFILLALSLAVAYFALPKIIVLILPFVLAYLIAKIIEPVVTLLNVRCKIPKKIASAVVVIITVALLIWFVSLLVVGIVNEISSLVAQKDMIAQKLLSVYYQAQDFVGRFLGSDAAKFITDNINVKEIVSEITGYLAGYIMPTIENTFNLAKQLPNILLFVVVLVMSTYFMSSDSETISAALGKLVPKKLKLVMSELKKDMSLALLGYIRAQLILMTVTFFEITVGFTIIGGSIANYALLLAIAIAIVDALPVLGAGLFLIPWGLYSFVTGNIRVGVSLLILYLICLLVRQILEPRVVGKQIGIHPLLTLMAIYCGFRLFGVVGMILGPVMVLIIKSMAEEGFFSALWMYICYGGIPEEKTGV